MSIDSSIEGVGVPVTDEDSDLSLFSRIEAVRTILRALTEMTRLRIAIVARVTPSSWTACAVLDEANFGLKPGDRLDVATTY